MTTPSQHGSHGQSRCGWLRPGRCRGLARVAPDPRAEPAWGADIPRHKGEGLAPEGALRPAEAGNDSVRDWRAISDHLGGEALPLEMEVYGWLSWATSGTTRGLRNRPFEAVLLRRDGGNREVPTGGGLAREEHGRVLRAVIRAGWPDRWPQWPAFLDGGEVLRVTDAEANVWLP